MAKKPVPTVAEYHAAWRRTFAPYVDGAIETVALLNPAGAVAAEAARVGGRTMGGLLGGFLGKKAAQAAVGGPAVPAVLAAVVTASAIHLFEVQTSADADELTVLGHWDTWARPGLRLEVARKVMSERLTFSLADGRSIQLDGMFAPRQRERLYQDLIDRLSD